MSDPEINAASSPAPATWDMIRLRSWVPVLVLPPSGGLRHKATAVSRLKV